MRFVVAVLLASCARPAVGPLPPQVTEPEPPLNTCPPSAPLPELDPAFAPELKGRVALVSANGDDRLSASGGVFSAWSADSAIVVLAGADGTTAWRVADGSLLDRIGCPGSANGDNAVAFSADQRWLVVSTIRRRGGDAHTCVLDRTTHQTKVYETSLANPRFDGELAIGDAHAIDLATGAISVRTPPSPAKPAVTPRTVPTPGTNRFAFSHDGRLLVAWYESPAFVLGGGTTAAQAGDQAVSLWNVETGSMIWRVRRASEDEWRFSPRDGYVESGRDVVRVADGKVLAFGGGMLPIAPDDDHVIVFTSGPELWSLSTMHRAVMGQRAREVVGRSRDGTVTAVMNGRHLAIERAGACFDLGVEQSPFIGNDPIALSPDGRTLYLGHDGGATISTSTAFTWDTATGTLVHATSVQGPVRIFPMPGVGRFAFETKNGLRFVDARTGAPDGSARAPRWTQGPFDAQGTSHAVRDRDGDHAETLVGRVVMSADGTQLVGNDSQGVAIWDLRDARRVVDLHVVMPASWVDPVAWSDDQHVVAAGRRDGVIELWTRDGRSIPVARRHDEWVEHLAFSRDGRVLASSSKDGAVHLIDTATGALIGSVALRDDHAQFLWWSETQLVIDTARRFHLVVTTR